MQEVEFTREKYPRDAKLISTLLCAALATLSVGPALASSPIDTRQPFYLSSNLGTSVNPDFQNGTLQLNSASPISNNFSVENFPNNTIDEHGNVVTMSGVFSGAGPLTFSDTVGGGNIVLTNSGNTYSGSTTINSGASLALSGSGTLALSSGIIDNGTFDISSTTSGASIVSLTGSGLVTLGTQPLTITAGSGNFSGAITGTGGIVLSGGTLQIGDNGTSGSLAGNVADSGTVAFDRSDTTTFSGIISGTGALSQLGTGTTILTSAQTYTGTTTISAGTLALSGSGGIAASSSVVDNGTLDFAGTTSAISVVALSGTGLVTLGSQSLTVTGASGANITSLFSGVISGPGGLVIAGGSQALSGANTYLGGTTITGGTLQIGDGTPSGSIVGNIADGSNLAFATGGATSFSGTISGTGQISQIGSGITSLTTAEFYTGTTTISAGTLALSGSGNIAASSSVIDNGVFDISAVTSPNSNITSLSGHGTVNLGTHSLTLTNASGTFSGAVSGTGSFVLAGGSETLGGSSSYTGPTMISAGTLSLSGGGSIAGSSSVIANGTFDISRVSSSIVSLSGAGTVALGAQNLTLTNAFGTFSGAISGTGGLILAGGTETINSSVGYSGRTTIEAGSLVLSGSGSIAATSELLDDGTFDASATTASTPVMLNSLAGNGSVELGSHPLNLTNASSPSTGSSFSGQISTTGGLVLSGGTEIITAALNYSGGTVISAATLQMGDGATSGSIAGDILNNGLLVFDPADLTLMPGAISGSGAVIQNGSGTTVLAAANSYSGGTTISVGTLQVGNGGTSGSIAGDIVDNGTLMFDRSDGVMFSGDISGTGSVGQLGSGTVGLSGTNTYTGTTNVAADGVLALAGAGSIADSAGVADNGTFDVSASTLPTSNIESLSGTGVVSLGAQTLTLTNASGSFSGEVTGTGGLVLGAGTEMLSGINAFGGPVVINGGVLIVNGSIATASGTSINSGATLSGNGAVPSTFVNSGGSLAPGNAGVGALNVSGNVTFASGSIYVVDVSAVSASKLLVSGTATLNGILNVASPSGTYPFGQQLTVLTATSGRIGTFTIPPGTGVSQNFSYQLSYDADDVFLRIDLAHLSPLSPNNSSINERSVTNGINTAIAKGVSLTVPFEELGNLPSNVLAGAADQLSGEIGSALPQVGRALLDPFLDALNDRMLDLGGGRSGEGPAASRARHGRLTGGWLTAFGGKNDVTGDLTGAGSHDLSSTVIGFVGGADWNLLPNLTVGAAVSAGSANFSLAENLGRGKARALQLGVYGFMQFTRHIYGSLAAAFASDNITTNRTVTVSGADQLSGKPNLDSFGARYETGLYFGWMTPYAAIQTELFQSPEYSETVSQGLSTFALRYSARSANTTRVELGGARSADVALGQDWTLNLSGRLAWAYDLSTEQSAQAAFESLPDSDFTTVGAQPGRNSALVSLGLKIESGNAVAFQTKIDSDWSGRSRTYFATAGIGINW